MNYYGPRQIDPAATERPDAGRWRYTCRTGDRVFPIGLCAQGCPGHDTRDEARAHYGEYLLDTTTYDGQVADQQLRCAAPTLAESGIATADVADVCGAWTDRFAATGPGRMLSWMLCDEHRNADVVRVLIGTPGDSFGSV